MNRHEAVTQIAQLCVLTNDKTVGVILPSGEEVELFQKELLVKLGEVANWLLNIQYQQRSRIVCNTGTQIRLLNNGLQTRGMAFNVFYISSRVTDEQKSEFVFSFLTTPTQAVLTFEDN